jgi:hypothetical protein
MHEQPQTLPLIEYLQTEEHRWIKLDQVESSLPKLINQGLQVLFICYEGRGVSRAMAELLCVEKKIPAVYLRFGLEALAKTETEMATRIIDHLSQVPIIVSYVPFTITHNGTEREQMIMAELATTISKTGHHLYQAGPNRQNPSLADILNQVESNRPQHN